MQDNREALKAMGWNEPTNEEIASLSEVKKEHKAPNVLKRINGWFRLWVWGVCPECNHDAPKLYDCEICNYYKELPRYRSEQTKQVKTKVWNSFLRGVANKV